MENLISFATKIEVGAKFIIPVYISVPINGQQKPYVIDCYEVTLTRVDESVYMVADNGKTGIESLTSFQANIDAGNYIELL